MPSTSWRNFLRALQCLVSSWTWTKWPTKESWYVTNLEGLKRYWIPSTQFLNLAVPLRVRLVEFLVACNMLILLSWDAMGVWRCASCETIFVLMGRRWHLKLVALWRCWSNDCCVESQGVFPGGMIRIQHPRCSSWEGMCKKLGLHSALKQYLYGYPGTAHLLGWNVTAPEQPKSNCGFLIQAAPEIPTSAGNVCCMKFLWRRPLLRRCYPQRGSIFGQPKLKPKLSLQPEPRTSQPCLWCVLTTLANAGPVDPGHGAQNTERQQRKW